MSDSSIEDLFDELEEEKAGFKRRNIVERHSKTRIEKGREVKYVITNDSFNDDYGSYQYDYNAWRIDGNEIKRLTSACAYHSEWSAENYIAFGKYIECKHCNQTRFVTEEELKNISTSDSNTKIAEVIDALKNPIAHVWNDVEEQRQFPVCCTPSANPDQMLAVVDANKLIKILQQINL